MVKSRVAENGRQIKRGNKKKKRKVLKISEVALTNLNKLDVFV